VIPWSLSRYLRWDDGHPSPSPHRKWRLYGTRPSHTQIGTVALSQSSALLVAGTTATSAVGLIRRPSLHLGAQPKLDPSVPLVQDGTGHVLVPMLVHAHGVAVSEPEQFGDAVGVDQFVQVDLSAHSPKITFVVGSVRAAS
jgi:hypothetical protein